MEYFAVPPIGHSTGWFSAKVTPSLLVQSDVLSMSGGTACEMACGDERRMQEMKKGLLETVTPLEWVSLHLPDMRNVALLGDEEAAIVGGNWQDLVARFSALGTSLHPDLANGDVLARLKTWKIPVGIENMDRLKTEGKTVAEVMSLCEQFGFPLVLDVQHAYENSIDRAAEAMTLATELAAAAVRANGISHLHVSGEIVKDGKQIVNHASLLYATNRQEILDSVRQVREICGGLPPIILEGDYLPNLPYRSDPLKGDNLLEAMQIASTLMREEREMVADALAKG